MSSDSITQIGKYRVLELVGEGAMGIVYRAEDTVLSRVVALKVMSEAIARQEELRGRFLREAQAAGSLQHPNVVTIYDFGEVDNHLFIAMEFVDGVDLERVLEERQPLTLDAKLGVIVDVLTGLAYAHKRGIVHRDIKPANIRISDEGRAKIMDFGVVYLTSSKMTRTGMMMGTPSYMAPEQVTGGQVGPPTDIFAAGAVLYELLTGCRPFDAPTLHSIMFKIVSEEPRDVLVAVPGLPSALGRIVNRALAKDMSVRYQSALEMANELSVVRAGLSGAPDSGTLSLRAAIAAGRGGSAVQVRARAKARAQRVAQWSGGLLAAGAAVATIWSAVAQQRNARAAAAPMEATHQVAVGQTPVATQPASVSSSPTPTQSTAHSATARSAAIVPRPGELSPSHKVGGAPSIGLGNAASLVVDRALATPSISAPLTAPVAEAPPPPPIVVVHAPSTITTTVVPNPAAGVADAVAAYARAIQSRDPGTIRRVYPGITSAQQHGFAQFFDAARSLRVSFSVSELDVSGTTAEARVSGTYAYTGADGRRQQQPITFHATLEQDGAAWRLLSVR